MTTARKALLVVVMVPLAVLLTLGTIGFASAHPAGTSAAQPAAHRRPTIKISSFMFTVPAHVRPGARVRVVNKDGVLHSVTADGGAFAVDVPAGTTVRFDAPATAGSYPFHCRIHTTMHGTLVVKAPASAPSTR